MTLTLRTLHPLFGVEVLDVDVKRLDDPTLKEIVDAFNEHSVRLFRGQRLADEEQIAFSRSGDASHDGSRRRADGCT